MPVYDVAAVAEALDMSAKQLDNIICRHAIPGVERHRRGVMRRLSPSAAVIIRLASDLVESLRLPTAHALHVAQRLERHENAARVQVGDFAVLSVDLPLLRAVTAERLNTAVESVGRRRRGRPPAGQRRRSEAPR